MSQATMKSKPGYIPGAKMGDFVTSTKKNLGQEPVVTVLGIFKLYGEYEPDRVEDGQKVQGKMRRYVLPEDAVQIKAIAQNLGLPADNFNIAMPNGNTLRPMHWVYLYLHGEPEIENAVYTLRSTGNRIATALEKTIQQSGASHASELRFRMTAKEVSNENYEWYAPEFEMLPQRNFKIADGTVQAVKGGFSKEELAHALKLSNEQRKAYASGSLVSKIDIKALQAAQPRAAIADSDYANELADDAVNF
jgi:hypothetical protein